MVNEDHPIYKHVQQDAASRARRGVPGGDPSPAGGSPAGGGLPPGQPIAPEVSGGSSDQEIVAPPALGVRHDRPAAGSGALPPPQLNQVLPGPMPVIDAPAPRQRGLTRRLLGAVLPPYGKAAGGRAGDGASLRQREKLVHALRDRPMRKHTRHCLVARSSEPTPAGKLVDTLLAGPGDPKLPDETFPRLRWGGVFAFVGMSEKSVRNLAESYDSKRGFILEVPPTPIHAGPPLPGMRTAGHYFMARKVHLLQPGDTTERFTYHVELTPCAVGPNTPDGYMVTKRVPTLENMVWRLRVKFPQVDIGDLEKRAEKLINHVFPTFLTREAAMLGILQKNLAPEYRDKVPRPLGIEKDSRGFVRTLHMNWMRVGGPTLSQLEFAEQSAELLTALHEQARVMHLDLRMDNMVITPDGVGFVDFGSACRIGEEIGESPMLDTLFSEMMRTSQIQRMLGKMLERGHVTNQAMADVHGKVDKTVDSFYLAVQITKPHGNPEIKQLIDFDPETPTAHALSSLTAAVLRPKNPAMAQYKSARDILRGIHRIRRRVEEDAPRRRSKRRGSAA